MTDPHTSPTAPGPGPQPPRAPQQRAPSAPEPFDLDALDAAEVRALHAELQQRQAEHALAQERLDLARVAYQARIAQLRKRYSEGGQYEVVGTLDLVARKGQRVRVREGGSEG